MKIFIFGGTSEGRILAKKLRESGNEIVVSVATEMGAEPMEGSDVTILSGRLEKDEMQDAISGSDIVIDATHPYATAATANIKNACDDVGIRYVRVVRDDAGEDVTGDDIIYVDGHEEAAEYLSRTDGNILLTIGTKNLPCYESMGRERLIVRTLPVIASLKECEDMKIPHANIIAMQGPFSQMLNEAMIGQYDIRYMVTKESGRAGGFFEKVMACRETGTTLLVIRAPRETGMSVDEVVEMING